MSGCNLRRTAGLWRWGCEVLEGGTESSSCCRANPVFTPPGDAQLPGVQGTRWAGLRCDFSRTQAAAMISLAFSLISDSAPGPRGIQRLHLVICFAGLYLLPRGLLPASLSGVSSCETNTPWSKEPEEGGSPRAETTELEAPRPGAEAWAMHWGGPCPRRPPGQSPDQQLNGVVALLSSLGLPAPGPGAC